MTDRQLAERMAEALGQALIPLACFQITDKQRPYTEIGSDMRTALNGAHDSIVEALAAFREARERERAAWYKLSDDGSEYFKSGDQYELQGEWTEVPHSWIGTKVVACRSYSGFRRPLPKEADHFVDANKKPQNNPTPTTSCTSSSQDPN